MSNEKPIIAKITLLIGDTKAQVTLEQAKKLHAALGEMFGAKETIVYRDNYHWPWSRPYYTYGAGLLERIDGGLVSGSAGTGLSQTDSADYLINRINAGEKFSADAESIARSTYTLAIE